MSTDNRWVRLRRHRARLRRLLLAVVPRRGGDDLAVRAEALRGRGVELAAQRRYPEAAAAFEQAVECYLRAPLGNTTSIFWTRYALALMLGGAGRYAEALSLASGLRWPLRAMSWSRPGRRPQYAELLQKMSYWQGEVGRPDRGLKTARRAAAEFRRLVAEHGVRHERGLAAALIVLAHQLQLLDRDAEAVPPLREAAGLYRRAADGDEPLGATLAELGQRLRGLTGHRTEALAVQREAVEVTRRLVAGDPEQFRPVLAGRLLALGVIAGRVGLVTDAQAACAEAVPLARQAYAADPDRYADLLHTALALAQHRTTSAQ
ncbi:tetratricopeptide repeat protein [Micromonospora sp. WMMD1102]|uniref:tetratricopeptide repeat protein n=1 Tax=Micromonospora sp. WMMD1102 TaxID=3016105 RepID=UPI002414E12D|nr:tetratricopeptide repeat protein [Micromonospora sp. WMMD1102]MDG4790541.1 tetratricopeptide repeat protein [Micromonospora sp. WMMD1102]